MYNVTPVTSPKSMDCGATCLKMLLSFYGIDAPLDELIEECNTRINGSNARDVMVAGRGRGLEMICFKMDAEELLKQDRPAIIWWRFYHFVVFCGLNDKGEPVIINPDRGRYAIDAGTFKSLYSEVALFNGEPETLPDKEPAGDYEARIRLLEDELAAAKIILGVE